MSVAGMGWLMAVVLAFVLWRHEQLDEGLLIWTGQAWFWRAQQAEELPIRMALLLDAGGCLLVAVKIEPDQPNKKSLTRYACFTHRSMPSLWHGFRCAVYSRPMAVALDSPRNGP
jgi:hypothetical protein